MNTCRYCHQFTNKEFCNEKCYEEYLQALKELQCERCTESYKESDSTKPNKFCSKDCEEEQKEKIKVLNEDLSDWDYSMN